MIQMEYTHRFTKDELTKFDKDELVKMLRVSIKREFGKTIDRLIDDDELVLDTEIDRETGDVRFTTSAIIFDKNDFESSIECIASHLAEFGMDEENIVDTLSCIATNWKGF